MLFSALVSLIFLIIIFLFATAKLSVFLGNTPYLNVFYVLMFITFLTVLEIIFCVYMYLKFRTKDGEEGPRGYHGFPGDKGDPGKCNQQTCRPEVIRVMIEKIFQKKLGRELKSQEKDYLLHENILNLLQEKSFKQSKFSLIENDTTKIENLTFNQVKNIHEVITKDVELDYLQLDDNLENNLREYYFNE